MRAFGFAVTASVVVIFAVIQGLSGIALHRDATFGSWTTVVPASVTNAVDTLDPALPIPPALRLVLARQALASHDLARAGAHVARLPPSRDRFSLDAALASARGDRAGAVVALLAAGDLVGLEARVDELAGERRFAEALALERATIERLRTDPTQVDALAEASFRLGRLEERQAYAIVRGGAERHVHESRALDAYAVAARLSPLSQQNLLAYGNQQLNVGDLAGAVRTFERARDADPTSADAVIGLGDAALRRGDRVAARAYLARARAIDPTSTALARLARAIGS